MAGKRFDRKFGAGLVRGLPEAPGVYLFRDEAGDALYVGKAANLRRRLASYRNAGRRAAHRKQRTLVREAHSLEFHCRASEVEALLLENELIRALRPRYNVDGAFDFLYPAIGTGHSGPRLVLCLTTRIEAYAPLALRWHGVFRPRQRARDAFDALVFLLSRIGHLEPRSRLPRAPRVRGSRLVALRRTPPGLLASLRDFLDGRSDELLGTLFAALLERPAARREATAVQASLESLASFFAADVLRLRRARERTGFADRFVPQARRDALFLEARRCQTGADELAEHRRPSTAVPTTPAR
jgi:excinuclease ABC subunit C